jgi:hypothetical protein
MQESVPRIGRADLHHDFEVMALDWLQTRHVERVEASGNLLALIDEPDAVARATAVDLKELPQQQAAVVKWMSRRYKVAPEPVGRLVQEAWTIGERAKLDPTLILAIMAIESSFNPFAQSPMGAQGLMQVMTRVHDDKYEAFGGTLAAFDPVTNLRVGVQVLVECIKRAGSVEAGLRYYVGAALLEHDNGYTARVLAEQRPPATRVAGPARAVQRQQPPAGGARSRSLPRARRRAPGRGGARRHAGRLRDPSASTPRPGCPRRRGAGATLKPCATGDRGGCCRTEVDHHREAQARVLCRAGPAVRLGSPPPCSTLRGRDGPSTRTRRGLPCSTVPVPPSPTSTPRPGPPSRPRTAARKSTSSSSPARTTPRRR